MVLSLGTPLDDDPLQDVGNTIEAQYLFRHLLSDQCARRSSGTTDAQGQMTGVAAHHGDKKPSFGRNRIQHQIAHEVLAQVTRRRKSEAHDVAGQRQVVINSLGNMGDSHFGKRLGNLGRPIARIVSSYGQQVLNIKAPQRVRNTFDAIGAAGRVGYRGKQDRTALEVNARDIADIKLYDMSRSP